MPAVGVAQLDLEDPRAGLQAHGMPFRAGEVPVRVDQHGPGAVCLHRTPLDRVERGGRQREHMLLLRFEQAGDGHAEPVMVGLREPFARVEPRACQCLVTLRRRDRHHQVTAHEPDRVLHTALLVARVRVAEPRLEPVLRAEPLEHHGLRDRAVRVAVPHARGVVEHHHARRHPDTREHLAQPVAHTPRRLTRQRRDIPHVRIRVRDHQEMNHTLHARDRRARLAGNQPARSPAPTRAAHTPPTPRDAAPATA